MQGEYNILDHVYPASFLCSDNKFFVRLPLLSADVLLSCVRRFRDSVPKGERTKTGYIGLIKSDYAQQTNNLVQFSAEEILRSVSSTSPNSTDHSKLRFPSICRFIHNRYGTVIASQLLCSLARWNPPDVSDDGLCLPPWTQTPPSQLRSRLMKVNAATIKSYCDLYAAPNHSPRLKTERYNLLIEKFRARSLYLLSLSNVEFAKEYIASLPQSLPDPSLPRGHLLEVLLREEFGEEISQRLISLPSAEILKEKNKQTRREKHAATVSDSRAAREAYIDSWPQVVPKDIMMNFQIIWKFSALLRFYNIAADEEGEE
ncbi:hypothetical protein BJ322DRAFT_1186232 [Thelephora terrestris]|uniref:Uncharacterized protein n=1 Tax=Thelephora terrestris TaxID=56493 RepID=A0A9P6L8U5_9AGAM|nr:hypothetical protein BJ322DRAFT_1186232 [Thelephora terrestris]